MLVKNIDENLVNGTVGRILGFHTIHSCQASSRSLAPHAAQMESSMSASSSTRSTGSPVPKAKGPVRNIQVGPDGHTPIALCLKSALDKENIALMSLQGRVNDPECYPLVEFHTQRGNEVVLVVRDEFRVEDNEGALLARRVQVRLHEPHDDGSVEPTLLCRLVSSSFHLSLPGPCRYTRVKVRRSNMSRSILAVFSRRDRAMLPSRGLLPWRVYRCWDLMQRRYVHLLVSLLQRKSEFPLMQVKAHPRVVAWNESIQVAARTSVHEV